MKPASPEVKNVGVNLGSLYLPVRAVDDNPIFSTSPDQSQFAQESPQSLHVALVKIRAPQSIDEPTLRGVGHTLSQLNLLGLSCVVVLDPDDGREADHFQRAKLVTQQADRIAEVIEAHGGQGARRLDSVVGVSLVDAQAQSSVKIRGGIHIIDRDLLLAPLRRGVIPIIVPVGFNPGDQKLAPVAADEVILALTREFAGLQTNTGIEELDKTAGDVQKLQKQISLDRLIVLDPLGGIPARDRNRGSHVFINLEQEFDSIKGDLMSVETQDSQDNKPRLSSPPRDASTTSTTSQIFSETLGYKTNNTGTKRESGSDAKTVFQLSLDHSNRNFHVQNLQLMKHTLALLPPASSAFLTTPEAVANSQSRPPLASHGPRVRTRRQRNPLIHNLLTDKPAFSSSLPSHRLRDPAAQGSAPPVTSSPATFFKRGMPLSIVPDPLVQAWTAPSASNPSITLSDPRIDLSRLTHLIEDSFDRKLDVPHYLNRIKDRIAGIIIAGEYEGGAVMTWETPPGVPADERERMVPYLDKFAVLKRSQGAGGVADIVFKALVRGCFPDGVCWRSRKNNPVNKWYFERAKGTWKMPGTNWTMFWTTEGVQIGDRLFSDYAEVCRTVQPSWADNKSHVD